MRFHRRAHIGVLLARAGEQLERQDVGVSIDDAAGHDRARFRHLGRAVAHARHEQPQHHRIAGEPDHDRQRQPLIGGGEQEHRAGAVDHDVPDRRDHRDQALAHSRPGLHHLVGDAAGEIVLEERPALAHHMPVVLPADHVGDVGRDRLIGDEVLRRDAQADGAISSTNAMPSSRCHCSAISVFGLLAVIERHHVAHEDRDGGVEQRDDEAGDEQHARTAISPAWQNANRSAISVAGGSAWVGVCVGARNFSNRFSIFSIGKVRSHRQTEKAAQDAPPLSAFRIRMPFI